VWLVGGTRPEALKLAPVVTALRHRLVKPLVVATGQHPAMFHQGLAAFGIEPDIDIRLHRRAGTQAELAAGLLDALDREICQRPPGAIVVQGDTSSAFVGAMAAFWRQVPVVHLEAGLRSHDLTSPFPEEGNRKLIAQVAACHLAPTRAAAENLLAEGVPAARVTITGNTVVDAALTIAESRRDYSVAALRKIDEDLASGCRLLLVTMHRRESWGEPLRNVLNAVRDLLALHPDLRVVLPAHPNPIVYSDVVEALGGHPDVTITEPLAYPDLVWAMARSTLILSDSGGIQEEAPSFGVPVLVLREVTERMEAVDAGCALLLGTDRARIVETALRLLGDDSERARMTSCGNPFGDGRAARRAAAVIMRLLGLPAEAVGDFHAPHLAPAAIA
jgi:UDP-N-acetylglucosamine 2-epimerase (non-hydrolysing)